MIERNLTVLAEGCGCRDGDAKLFMGAGLSR